jgi:uncharacterized protein
MPPDGFRPERAGVEPSPMVHGLANEQAPDCCAVLHSLTQLSEFYRQPNRGALEKEIDHLDEHCRAFIAHSPFAVLATSNDNGRVDVSPKGGPPGFVAVLDSHRLAVPDMSGNNRLDSFRNILNDGALSLLFFVPGIGETLRVVGQGVLSTHETILDRCHVEGMRPNVALVATTTTAYIHCAKALRRSGLWDPSRWPKTTDLATPAQMMRDHIQSPTSTEEMQQYMDHAYGTTTWAMGGKKPSGSDAD